MTTPPIISPAEAMDRRLSVEAAPLAECPNCQGELVRVGLRLVCESCGLLPGGSESEAA